MKQFGFLCLFFSILSVGFGVYLIVLSSTNFIPDTFSICRLTVGSVWSLCGAAMFFAAVKILIVERIEKIFNRKNNDAR